MYVMENAHDAASPLLDPESKTALTRYFSLLLQVEQRLVSSRIVTSSSFQEPASHGCIDKLNGILRTPLKLTDLEKRGDKTGYMVKISPLRDRKPYFQVGDKNWGWRFQVPFPGTSEITKMVSRPSAFSTFREYYDTLSQVLTEEQIQNLSISRLDLTVDFEIPFKSLIGNIDIAHKQFRTEYRNKGSKRLNMLIGVGREKILIYDKELESGSSSPWSRIELQLSGKNLPTRGLYSLPNQLLPALSSGAIFKAVILQNVELMPFEGLGVSSREKHKELEVMLKREGYYEARKKLDENSNFQRDYGRFIKISKWKTQPADILKRNLAGYFG